MVIDDVMISMDSMTRFRGTHLCENVLSKGACISSLRSTYPAVLELQTDKTYRSRHPNVSRSLNKTLFHTCEALQRHMHIMDTTC